MLKRDFINITHVIVVAGVLRTKNTNDYLTLFLLRETCIEELISRRRQRFPIEKKHFVFKIEEFKLD